MVTALKHKPILKKRTAQVYRHHADRYKRLSQVRSSPLVQICGMGFCERKCRDLREWATSV